ncbi:MAG TPA: NUDIX domain-containing protein [Roseiflexaceae bacterium]|nr:NUDIX domain-containing protein [Roseiflexaceae bacterium]
MSNRPRPWTVLGRETIYTSPWVRLHRDDVRLPDGTVIAGHHVVDFPRPAVAVVPVGGDGRVLLIEHYRFITDTFGWELPAGVVDAGEDEAAAAARELREEAGATAARLEYLGRFHPINGSTNGTFHVYIGHGAAQDGTIADTNEVLGAAWFEPDVIWGMLERNEILDGLSLTGLLWYLARLRG